jgi:hypothetical protein
VLVDQNGTPVQARARAKGTEYFTLDESAGRAGFPEPGGPSIDLSTPQILYSARLAIFPAILVAIMIDH